MIENRIFSNQLIRGFIFFYITLMSVQIIPIEGMDVSIVKAIGMSFAPFVLILYGKQLRLNQALVWGMIYFSSIVCCSLLAFDTVQWNRIVFRGLYICMFIVVVQFMCFKIVSLESFLSYLKILIFAYIIILILQQICLAIGLLNIPFLNLIKSRLPQNFLKVNSLAIEASHAARILTILFWTFIRILEIKKNSHVTVFDLLTDNKWITIGFLYAMLSMGSATALVGIMVISVHFFKNSNSATMAIIVIGIIVFQFMAEQMERVSNIIESFSAEDVGRQMRRNEASGAARMMGIVNTFNNLDWTTKEAWIGQGSSFLRSINNIYSSKMMIGDITNYGFITYFFSLLFVFRASIHRIISIETLIFITLLGAGIGSNYYIWSALLLFYMINYYEREYEFKISNRKGI